MLSDAIGHAATLGVDQCPGKHLHLWIFGSLSSQIHWKHQGTARIKAWKKKAVENHTRTSQSAASELGPGRTTVSTNRSPVWQ